LEDDDELLSTQASQCSISDESTITLSQASANSSLVMDVEYGQPSLEELAR